MEPERPLDPVGTLDAPPPVPERLPDAAWALGVLFLVDQLAHVAEAGLRSGDDWPLSMLLGAVLVGWFSAGVLAARTFRLAVAWVLCVLAVPLQLVTVARDGGAGLLGWEGIHLVLAVAELAALAWFCRTDYYAWQRTRPTAPGPSRAPVLALAVLVGLLGGVIESPAGSGLFVRLDIG